MLLRRFQERIPPLAAERQQRKRDTVLAAGRPDPDNSSERLGDRDIGILETCSMKRMRALAVAGAVGLTGLTGCFSSVRQVAKVQTVGNFRTASVQELETGLAERDAAIRTLSATVLITATTGGGREGKVKTYTSFRGYIFVQKPRNLRVIMELPVVRSKAMDMVSNGSTFELLIPPHNVAFTGANEVTKRSPNALENLRPAVFLDSLLIPGFGTDDYVAMTESTHVLEAAHGHKAEIDEPDYDLSVYRKRTDRLLNPERVIHISRVTLLPYEQDSYDAEGRVETQATYANYAPVGETQFPRLITISQPLNELSLRVEITKLTLNAQFPSDEFELKIPPGVRVQHMD